MKTKLNLQIAAVLAAVILATSQAEAAIELVSNGGFETGDFTGWTEFGIPDSVSSDPPLVVQGVDEFSERTGRYGAWFGDFDSTSGIFQDLTTVVGTDYQLSFWLRNSVRGTSTSYLVELNGVDIFGEDDSLPFEYSASLPNPFTFLFKATDVTTRLTFTFQHDADFFNLDDVSVQEFIANPIPEPASLTLWSLGALGLGLIYRRRKRVG